MPAYPWNIPVHPWCVNSNLSNILLNDIDQPLCIKYISHWISINISPVHGKKVSELYLELCTWELKMSAPIQPCKVNRPIRADSNRCWPISSEDELQCNRPMKISTSLVSSSLIHPYIRDYFLIFFSVNLYLQNVVFVLILSMNYTF